MEFSFDYYESTFTSIYIAASGYIGFTNSGEWPWNLYLPSEPDPNNVIAPYVAPLRLATAGPANRIYYLRGGSEPNRYFIVEWYQVMDLPGMTFTYQVILHESGDIVFNYLSMPTSMACASSGIEDGYGLDGLSYFDLCDTPPTAPSVRFTRPGDTARVDILAPATSQFSHADDLAAFPVTIRNIGELGSDTYALTSTSTWPMSFFDTDGVTSITDTGSIAQGSSRISDRKNADPLIGIHW